MFITDKRGYPKEGEYAGRFLSESGAKLTVIVPKELRGNVTRLLWKKGLSRRIVIATYNINLELP